MKFTYKYVVMLSFFLIEIFCHTMNAFEETKSEKTFDTSAKKRDMYERYDKLDALISYVRKRIDDLEDKDDDEDEYFDVDEADFIAMYDEMPDNLKQALIRIYFSMSISEQNEILIALGCNVYLIRNLIAKEMQKRIEASAIQEQKKEKSVITSSEKKVRFADKQVVHTPRLKQPTYEVKKSFSKEKQKASFVEKGEKKVQPKFQKYVTY